MLLPSSLGTILSFFLSSLLFTGLWLATDEIVADVKKLGLNDEIDEFWLGWIVTASFTINGFINSVDVNCGWPKS